MNEKWKTLALDFMRGSLPHRQTLKIGVIIISIILLLVGTMRVAGYDLPNRGDAPSWREQIAQEKASGNYARWRDTIRMEFDTSSNLPPCWSFPQSFPYGYSVRFNSNQTKYVWEYYDNNTMIGLEYKCEDLQGDWERKH